MVEIRDMKTDEIVVYPSMYKAGTALVQDTILISENDGKEWRRRYAIKILTESI